MMTAIGNISNQSHHQCKKHKHHTYDRSNNGISYLKYSSSLQKRKAYKYNNADKNDAAIELKIVKLLTC